MKPDEAYDAYLKPRITVLQIFAIDHGRMKNIYFSNAQHNLESPKLQNSWFFMKWTQHILFSLKLRRPFFYLYTIFLSFPKTQSTDRVDNDPRESSAYGVHVVQWEAQQHLRNIIK